MSDRLDIDALLIGSLYGELSSSDEARLQAHLESHPADRTALADLTYARTAVRESRIFQVQAEPPQQISALLMQEAARRAPRPQVEREGWIARFVASLRHPAMAAAAMLVVVVGVAGTMYVRKGDQFAAQTKSASEPAESSLAAGSAPAAEQTALAGSGSAAAEPVATGALAPEGLASATDDFRVSLEETGASRAGDGRVVQEKAAPPKGAATKRQETVGSLEVTTPMRRPMPQDLADEKPAEQSKRDFAEPPAQAKPAKPTTDRSRGIATSDQPQPKTPAAPPPPAPAFGDAGGTATARAPGAAQPPADAKDQQAADKESKSSVDIAWAKSQHVKVAERVRAGKCGEAATLAVQLSSRVPSYYQQYVENDRDLKSCFTAINRERELEAERVQKRAKRSNEDAAPRPAGTK